MTEPRKSAPAAAKKTAAPAPAAPGTDQRMDAVLSLLGQLQAALTDAHTELQATHLDVAALHAKVDAFKVRADEAEKLLSSPGIKAARAIGKAWKGIG